MDSIQELIAAVLVVVGIVSTIFARFQETSSELGFFARVMRTFDITQIFDGTRSLSDGPEDLDDGEGFDAPVSDE